MSNQDHSTLNNLHRLETDIEEEEDEKLCIECDDPMGDDDNEICHNCEAEMEEMDDEG